MKGLSKSIASFSVAVISAGLLTLSANAARQNNFNAQKQRLIQRTELRIQRLENYKACLEKAANYRDLRHCKVKYLHPKKHKKHYKKHHKNHAQSQRAQGNKPANRAGNR